jgi:hypothetical protein
MTFRRNFERFAAISVCLCWFMESSVAQQHAEEPETVVVTLHAKPGGEAELERVISRHWTTAHEMKLVRDTPHLTIRGIEDGDKPYFIDIFTWRDPSAPDTAPAEIRKIWDEMNRLVEARGGRPGLEFTTVSVVAQ